MNCPQIRSISNRLDGPNQISEAKPGQMMSRLGLQWPITEKQHKVWWCRWSQSSNCPVRIGIYKLHYNLYNVFNEENHTRFNTVIFICMDWFAAVKCQINFSSASCSLQFLTLTMLCYLPAAPPPPLREVQTAEEKAALCVH